jgi:hypothetical protein
LIVRLRGRRERIVRVMVPGEPARAMHAKHGYVYLERQRMPVRSESDVRLNFVALIGRPPGSTDGVTPVGGFPDVNAEARS